MSLVWTVLNIILFFKIWKMTDDVAEIHDEILNRRVNVGSPATLPPTPTNSPHAATVAPQASAEFQTPNLKKGDKVTLKWYGVCTFEGIWDGKYGFYPIKTDNLPPSPFLVEGAEPYLLIPLKNLHEYLA